MNKLSTMILWLPIAAFCMDTQQIKKIAIRADQEVTISQGSTTEDMHLGLDLTAQEALTRSTFKELIEEQEKEKLPFILAVVKTHVQTRSIYNFYSAIELQKALESTSNIDPANRQPIVGDITYWTIYKPQDTFTYLCSRSDMSTLEPDKQDRKKFLHTYFTASTGDHDALFELSLLYRQGKGAKENLPVALYFAKISSKKNNAKAQHCMALAYLDRKSKKHKPQKALTLLAQAHTNDNIDATNDLAEICWGTGKIEEAIKLWTTGVERMNPRSLCKLGDANWALSNIIFGNEKNHYQEAAITYWGISAELGYADAQYALVHYGESSFDQRYQRHAPVQHPLTKIFKTMLLNTIGRISPIIHTWASQ